MDLLTAATNANEMEDKVALVASLIANILQMSIAMAHE